MADEINFDSTGIPPRTGADPIPNDWYRAMVVESSVKPTKEGTGKYLQLNWQVLDGPYKGSIVFDRFNVQNPSATAQKIAQEALSAVCHATGVLKLSNSKQLHNIPVMIKVVVKQKDKNYDPQNEVKQYKAIEGAGSTPQSPVTASSATAPAANAPTWARKAG